MADLIRLKNIYKVYNPGEESEVRALDGVSMVIHKGEFVAILGSSGSGKSTLMNILGCLDTPSYGEYHLAGEDISSLSDNSLSIIRNNAIGFIFQGYNLISDLNALENVELPLIYRGVHKSKRQELARHALAKVGLEKRMYHLPSEMSGGQQQRVAIARAVSTMPAIVMADEPTGNLDSKSGADVMEILTQFNRAGKTIILITHDKSVADYAGRTIELLDGKIISDTVVSREAVGV